MIYHSCWSLKRNIFRLRTLFNINVFQNRNKGGVGSTARQHLAKGKVIEKSFGDQEIAPTRSFSTGKTSFRTPREAIDVLKPYTNQANTTPFQLGPSIKDGLFYPALFYKAE